jgi:hypothetical protein
LVRLLPVSQLRLDLEVPLVQYYLVLQLVLLLLVHLTLLDPELLIDLMFHYFPELLLIQYYPVLPLVLLLLVHQTLVILELLELRLIQYYLELQLVRLLLVHRILAILELLELPLIQYYLELQLVQCLPLILEILLNPEHLEIPVLLEHQKYPKIQKFQRMFYCINTQGYHPSH